MKINKLKTISAVAMMGLILPVSLLASIGDAVKKTEYLGWEAQATFEIWKVIGDLEKPKTPELVYGMLVSGRTIVQLRLNMQKARIDAIDLDDNSLETTYKNELGTLLDGIREDFENKGEEVMDLGETLSIDDFGDIDDLDSAEIDTLKQKLLDLFAAFYGPNSLNSRLSILTWKVNAVARYELYMAHAKRLTDEIVNVLPASLYTGDIVTKVDAYKAGELATMKACAIEAYGLSTKTAIKEKIKGDCETAQKASNDKFEEIKKLKTDLMATYIPAPGVTSSGGGASTGYGQTVGGKDICAGNCQDTSTPCRTTGGYQPLKCPGPTSWQCCPDAVSSPIPPCSGECKSDPYGIRLCAGGKSTIPGSCAEYYICCEIQSSIPTQIAPPTGWVCNGGETSCTTESCTCTCRPIANTDKVQTGQNAWKCMVRPTCTGGVASCATGLCTCTCPANKSNQVWIGTNAWKCEEELSDPAPPATDCSHRTIPYQQCSAPRSYRCVEMGTDDQWRCLCPSGQIWNSGKCSMQF